MQAHTTGYVIAELQKRCDHSPLSYRMSSGCSLSCQTSFIMKSLKTSTTWISSGESTLPKGCTTRLSSSCKRVDTHPEQRTSSVLITSGAIHLLLVDRDTNHANMDRSIPRCCSARCRSYGFHFAIFVFFHWGPMQMEVSSGLILSE